MMLQEMELALLELKNRIHAAPAWESAKMLSLYQEYARKVLAVDSVSWLAAYAGPYGKECWKTELLNGWKVTDVVYLDKAHEIPQSHYYSYVQKNGKEPLTQLALATVGKTRVLHIDTAELEQLKSHPEQKGYCEHLGVSQRMLGVYHLDEQAESYLMADRLSRGKPFSQQDKENLYRLLVEFPRVHYWLFLERGLIPPAERPIGPRYQEVLTLLQQNLTEAEIADQCKLSSGTIHGYIMDIYKIFNVSSRAELMSLWFQGVTVIN